MNQPNDKGLPILLLKHIFYWNSVLFLGLITALEVYYYNERTVFWSLYAIAVGAMILGIMSWIFWDSKEREVELSYGFYAFTFLIGPVMLLTYYSKTRGFKKGMRTLLGLALYIPYYLAYYATWNVTASILNQIKNT